MMEYKRLTERRGSLVIDKCGNCENVSNPMGCTESMCYEIMKNRLAKLEDKIENGTLIELPCKVGDTVYYETFINSESQWIKPHKVIGFVLEVMTQDVGGFGCTSVPIRDFGKDVFLTREEAEKRLRELQGDKE